jgi:tetratricopeptide (TPR) repeat protein
MKPILFCSFLVFLSIAAFGCAQKPPKVLTPDDPDWAKQRDINRKLDDLLQRGEYCLRQCRDIEFHKSRLIEIDNVPYYSPQIADLVNKQRTFYEEAEGCYREALRLDPESMLVHQALCQIEAKLGKYDDAIEHGMQVLKTTPARMMIYRDVAVAYERKANLAQNEYNRKLKDGNQEAPSKKAEAIKDYEEAVRIIMEYYPQDPDNVGQAQAVWHIGLIWYEKLAVLYTGADRLKQYNNIIGVLGNFVKEHPSNLFADDMKAMVDAAAEKKADYEAGYDE